ncbi:hypothetical protein CONLIGDRAFT_631223 [Coniochaeta ligniaria NRRL 30616]|uniref:Uncharacterized protein n=1 Tax=Coniochaeta ligniaria NRRL 30616 TaxID=1408157 RepID=A0A1J7IUF3_9PEZI|nr:hypothetical protein CONLIGDRAFT_631223 [Coniochaeta ligniaria NRRL 30616]
MAQIHSPHTRRVCQNENKFHTKLFPFHSLSHMNSTITISLSADSSPLISPVTKTQMKNSNHTKPCHSLPLYRIAKLRTMSGTSYGTKDSVPSSSAMPCDPARIYRTSLSDLLQSVGCRVRYSMLNCGYPSCA